MRAISLQVSGFPSILHTFAHCCNKSHETCHCHLTALTGLQVGLPLLFQQDQICLLWRNEWSFVSSIPRQSVQIFPLDPGSINAGSKGKTHARLRHRRACWRRRQGVLLQVNLCSYVLSTAPCAYDAPAGLCCLTVCALLSLVHVGEFSPPPNVCPKLVYFCKLQTRHLHSSNNTTLCETAFLYICMLNLSSQMRSDHRECRQQRLRKGWHAIVSIQLLLCRAVAQCTAPVTGLPEDKPRYVMGIGYPLDIVVCSALGADMFDSVYPTRTARFGVALVPEGVLKLKNAQYEEDFRCLLRPTSCSCDLAPPSSLASEFGLHLCNLAY